MNTNKDLNLPFGSVKGIVKSINKNATIGVSLKEQPEIYFPKAIFNFDKVSIGMEVLYQIRELPNGSQVQEIVKASDISSNFISEMITN